MTPKKHKFPRLWKPVSVHFGRPQTWSEWIVHPYGGNKNSVELDDLRRADSDVQSESLRELYREFTDQFMGTLAAMGAP